MPGQSVEWWLAVGFALSVPALWWFAWRYGWESGCPAKGDAEWE
jgi:hypothetical protein